MAAGNVYDWNKAIHACAKTQDWPRALSLLAEVAVEGLQATVVTYNSVLRACEWRCAQGLLRCIRDATLRRDTISLASSVSSVASATCWAEAARLLAASVFTALLPNLICCLALRGSTTHES
ncbi:PTAC2 [Symbiodinium microadriaticum]|nr:PTAC2 [Symbiodinium microadriaticum]